LKFLNFPLGRNGKNKKAFMLIEPLQLSNFLIFLIFFIPGFISVKIYDLLIPSERRDFSKSIFEVFAYSSLNYAVLSWWIFFILRINFYNNYPFIFALSLFCILFIIPALWPKILLKIISWKPIAKLVVSPVLKPWDFVFGQKRSFWVIINLRDGRKIGGKYYTRSYASSTPAEEQIYLEEVWKLDKNGKFIKAIEGSQGIIVLGKDISSIEFLI
jgi:hypothetical protein